MSLGNNVLMMPNNKSTVRWHPVYVFRIQPYWLTPHALKTRGCGVFACNEIKATILVAIYFERRRKLHEYGK